MSVTKWVHLKYGDDGIKGLFEKCYRMLPDGGLFIVGVLCSVLQCVAVCCSVLQRKCYHMLPDGGIFIVVVCVAACWSVV